MYQHRGGKVSMQVAGFLLITLIALGVVYMFLKRKENFEDQSKVIFFYMNGCGWCEKFKPEWEKFKQMAGKQVITEEIEASKMTPEQQKKVRGFPTILIVKGGKEIEYDGDRTAADLMVKVKAA
jgi:thiol-disulfide isomerase/thioredoxin